MFLHRLHILIKSEKEEELCYIVILYSYGFYIYIVIFYLVKQICGTVPTNLINS